LALARRRYVAPVKEEKSVEFIARNLYGAAKERWLEKWARWIDELIHRYNVEDVQKALGIIDVYDLDELERFLIERCSGLTEGECMTRIEKELRDQGYRENVTEEMIQSMVDYVKTVEKQPEIEYGFPYEIRSQVQKLRDRPELDRDAAFKLVYDFLTSEGVPEDEARKIAEEIAATIQKLPPSKRKNVYEYAITQAKLTKQLTLDKWFKRVEEARKVIEEAKEDMRKDDWLVDVGNRIVNDARSLIEKKLVRRLTSEELDRLRKIVFGRLQELYDEGVSREVVERLYKQLVDWAEKEFYDSMPLYRRVKELAERIRVTPLVEVIRPPTKPPTAPEVREGFVRGMNILNWKEVSSTFKVLLANRTRDVEETRKAIEDWARARGLNVVYVDAIRFRRGEERYVTVVYYIDRTPSMCRVDCFNNECEFKGCDKDVVLYLVRFRNCYIAIYRYT